MHAHRLQNASKNAAQPPQPTTTALAELLSFQATPDEEKVLDDFEAFQRDHPFSLSSLTESLGLILEDWSQSTEP